MSTPEQMQRETEFRQRRERVLRGIGVLVGVFAGGLAVLGAAKHGTPAHFETAIQIFVTSLAAAGLWLWWSARRHWRCPACSVHWELGDALASSRWNHCSACGAALRAFPARDDKERQALTDFSLRSVSEPLLLAQLQRRRRRGALAAGAVVALGAGAWAFVRARGWGEAAEQGAVALFTGIALAVGLTSSRCPRCRVGMLSDAGRHCQRCGLHLGGTGGERPTEPEREPSTGPEGEAPEQIR